MDQGSVCPCLIILDKGKLALKVAMTTRDPFAEQNPRCSPTFQAPVDAKIHIIQMQGKSKMCQRFLLGWLLKISLLREAEIPPQEYSIFSKFIK